MKKYKILKTGKNKGRIKALRSFMNVSKGDVGGFVEKEENLSHEGDCWEKYKKVILLIGE